MIPPEIEERIELAANVDDTGFAVQDEKERKIFTSGAKFGYELAESKKGCDLWITFWKNGDGPSISYNKPNIDPRFGHVVHVRTVE